MRYNELFTIGKPLVHSKYGILFDELSDINPIYRKDVEHFCLIEGLKRKGIILTYIGYHEVANMVISHENRMAQSRAEKWKLDNFI